MPTHPPPSFSFVKYPRPLGVKLIEDFETSITPFLLSSLSNYSNFSMLFIYKLFGNFVFMKCFVAQSSITLLISSMVEKLNI